MGESSLHVDKGFNTSYEDCIENCLFYQMKCLLQYMVGRMERINGQTDSQGENNIKK